MEGACCNTKPQLHWKISKLSWLGCSSMPRLTIFQAVRSSPCYWFSNVIRTSFPLVLELLCTSGTETELLSNLPGEWDDHGRGLGPRRPEFSGSLTFGGSSGIFDHPSHLSRLILETARS